MRKSLNLVFLPFHTRYVEAQSENAALENKLTKLQEAQSENIVLENKLTKLKADQALWQDIFVKNTELENDLKKEKDWRSQLQASKESADDNVSQLSKELLFYKKVADVSAANMVNKKKITRDYYLKSICKIFWHLCIFLPRIMKIFNRKMSN